MPVFARHDAAEDDLLSAIDDVIKDLLRCHDVGSPPVDAVRLLQACGKSARASAQKARSKRSSGLRDRRPARSVARDVSQPRAAAIIGRSLTRAILRRTQFERSRASHDSEGWLDFLFTARLLMPTRWFREDFRRLGLDVQRLHARYSTASAEAVAWRLLDLEEPLVVTIFDNNQIVDRRSNVQHDGVPPTIDFAELAAQAYAHTYSRPRLENSPAVTARAWSVHRADWRREIVVARLDGESSKIAAWED